MNEGPSLIATADGLWRFLCLQEEAVETVLGQLDQSSSCAHGTSSERGRKARKEDILSHLEFLRPALEFGLLRPFVDYVRWFAAVQQAREIPVNDLVQSLSRLADFFTALLPGEDAEPVVAALNAGILALNDPSEDVPAYDHDMPEACAECEAFVVALIRGDQRTAMTLFRKVARHGKAFFEAELHLVQPAMYRIGKGWQANHISIAQEHLATALVHGLLAREVATAAPAPPTDRSVVLAAVEGNQHTLGLRIVADAFELAGWDVCYLGANTPSRSLVQLVRDKRPNLVGLSASMPHHLRSAREAIASLRSDLHGARPAVLLGGLAINQNSPLVRVLGADATGVNAKSAVEVAAHLVLPP